MIQSGTDLADFLPRRLAWGIVIAVLLVVAIFVLPFVNFGSGAKRDLNLADRNTYMQIIGLTKTEIQQKFGPPKLNDPVKNELIYDMPGTGGRFPMSLSTWVRIVFDQNDRCIRFSIED